VNDQDRKRKRALIVVQLVIYGYLLSIFLVQLYMRSQRDW
jgi:hypothetical protein